ncbi:DUF1839 family protein [Streptosporangium sp. NPDC006013]|uniref:DUF1839 family protein n=1 Tax=Streptosporangium sp. NPDC006013 TaxID=3155596 RepID=UPI0033BEBF94
MSLSVAAWRSPLSGHNPHPLHIDDQNDWIDTNCYTDLWIELLHGLGADPYPMLAFTVAIDFEGDQWTFFKPPFEDLDLLYGVEVIELAAYRSLFDHCATQVRLGRVPVLEVDAHYLRDVPGTYRERHRKTTIAVVGIDPAAKTATYLHNNGCYLAEPADAEGIFRTGRHAPGPETMPPYIEAVRLSRLHRRTSDDLMRLSTDLLGRHVARRAADNPVARFAATFSQEIDDLAAHGPDAFEGYAFSTLRQLGAASALQSRYLRWLTRAHHGAFEAAAEACERISQDAKRLILKSARAARAGRPHRGEALLASMAEAWEHSERCLRSVLDGEIRGGEERT